MQTQVFLFKVQKGEGKNKKIEIILILWKMERKKEKKSITRLFYVVFVLLLDISRKS